MQDILTELDSVYNPQRQSAQGIYQRGLEDTNPMESADLAGLEQAKKDSFDQITTGANRRGMFFSGVPLKEQAQYVGQNFLPGVANLKNRYAGIRGNLYQTLAQTLGNIDVEKNKYGRDIYNTEVAQDLEREKIAASERAAAASRAASGSGYSPTFGGGGFTDVLGAQNSAPGLDQIFGQTAQQAVPTNYAKTPTKQGFSAPLGRNVWYDQQGQVMTPAEVAAYENALAADKQKASNRLAVANTVLPGASGAAKSAMGAAKVVGNAAKSVGGFLSRNF